MSIMLIDGATQPAGSALRAKYCVIGSGMGGATVATKLAAAGQDVLLVEAGGTDRAVEGTESVQAENVGRSFNTPVTRCIELGGTSNQYHGLCAPLDPTDFERRPWITGSGWPITSRDLEPFYRQAAQVLEVPYAGWFDDTPLPAPITDGLGDLRFDHSVLEPKLLYTAKSPKRWKNELLELARRNAFRCMINATALELRHSSDGDAVTELLVGAGDHTVTVRADVFIVSCGALETPRLLLNSRHSRPVGIGNDADLVGRNLIDHPAGHFNKIGFQKVTAAPVFSGTPANLNPQANIIAGLMLKPEQQSRAGVGNHYLWVRPAFTAKRLDDELMLSYMKARGALDLSFRQVVGILTQPDILYRVLVHKFGVRPKYRFGDLWFVTEQLPNPDSRVTLSPDVKDRYGYPVARVNWNLSAADFERFHAYARVLFSAGLKSDQYNLARVDDPEVWNRNICSSAHHLGSARMGGSAATGVVDRELRVFGVPNLYLCDASVFPTGGSANPSLTITALALRLTQHLLSAGPEQVTVAEQAALT